MLGHTTVAEAMANATPEAMRRFANLARYLVKRNHDVFVADKYGCIPLQLAASTGNMEMVLALLEPYESTLVRKVKRNEYLNHQDTQIRFTALHGALNHGQHEVAVLLLEHGANPQILDITRMNAFQVVPTLEALQELLRLVVLHEEAVPTPAIAQLMIEVIKQQEARDKKEKADRVKAAAAAAEAARLTAADDEGKGKMDWAKAMGAAANMDYTQRMIFVAINKLVSSVSHGSAGDAEGIHHSEAAMARAAAEAGGEVGAIVKRLFTELYSKGEDKHNELWEYVQAAVDYNNYKLTKMMLDTISADCPRALASCNWEATMGPLIACFPDLFHNLLAKLQASAGRWGWRGHYERTSRTATTFWTPRFFLPFFPPSFLGSSFTRSWTCPTTTCLNSAVAYASVTGMGFNRPSLSLARSAGKGSAAQGKILIYQQLVEGLKQVNYVVVKAFFEKADQQVLNDMALYPIFKDFVMLISKKRTAEGFTESDSGRTRLLELLRDIKRQSYDAHMPDEMPNPLDRHRALSIKLKPEGQSKNGSGGGGSGGDCSSAGDDGNKPSSHVAQFLRFGVASATSTASGTSDATKRGSAGGGRLSGGLFGGGGGGGGGARPSGRGRKNGFGGRAGGGRISSVAAMGFDEEDPAEVEKQLSADLAVQTLNVSRVLRAAVAARKSMNVEATVLSITSWVNLNSKDRRAVFITGITTDLLKEMAKRFPSGCAKLLNLVSRDVLEQLVTLQVSANLLHRKDQLVKCSDVRNHFTWRAPELQHLADEKGFSERVVDALADYGIPFECTYKAAMEWDTTREHFAALIAAQFTGAELKELISNDIQLSKPPPDVPPGSFKAEPMTTLIKDMLREKLSFRIVEAILEAGSMNEATVYTNFRPGNPLYNTYHVNLYKPVYTHHFVQLLLTNWQKGVKDGQGNWTLRPWDKKFIDTIFAPNDPLCTALKSAYDNKLKDTQVYIENSAAAEGWAKKLRQNRHLVLSAFVCNPVLLHRWPVFVLMHMMLPIKDLLKALWFWMGWEWGTFGEPHTSHSVDARALVIPWKGMAHMGSTRGILTGLIDVDVPVRWFGFAAVKAAITVQWQEFGQMLMLMSALAHVIFMSLFGGFLMLLRSVGERENVRERPQVMALLIVLGLMSVGGLAEEVSQMMELTWRTWRNYLGNLVDLTSFALFMVLFGMVWSCYTYEVILAVGAIETLVLFVRLVFFASMTDSMGSLMRMVIEIMKDMRHFFTLLGMIFGGFAIAFAVLLGPGNTYEGVAFKLFSVMLGDWQFDYLLSMLTVVEKPNERQWYVPRLSVMLMSVYGILMLIVLVNLLIAIMNDTYDRIKETEEIEVLHNRARLIVDLESLLTKDMRDKLQARLLGDYLHVLVPADNKFNKFMASSESVEGEWKGRMRAFSQALKRDVEPHLKEIRSSTEAEFKAIHAELNYVRSWVAEQRRVMGEVDPGDHDLTGTAVFNPVVIVIIVVILTNTIATIATWPSRAVQPHS
ncbi:hypothetical protein VOLCADRAFT_118752 [Volvox carteri f. nagariensis]|uniref:Ion transport domain-containing protein n=1 Tax=Volvox carteri f. nagariensis TaxID=3068 RepID=D8U786_VOLCA|nr:uncharacterized protein VOLCADRAFT_118752 [Volvox carteri f. nagariensis]EFJ44379.1 hypothetical protein VOLCADRAFT_118752 [Volvox carteri f. nagariensis]|eukprot:XP_002954486.1 hypothetical protein VOLCADRAFT_118752 [Volvox carteri f. nagariensis]